MTKGITMTGTIEDIDYWTSVMVVWMIESMRLGNDEVEE